ncbi:hypothetical protein PFISCL1PPCAC_18615 [Pristionchus fissidentatus]|uniref:Uncharacterized protein n=1 Tax=Pristionchus fissidentatus TaxID=1538716 RepID=A0AAV5W705_9BILA|nr:hypothetical protein PFISCL1PPCAC_18615 [Pristionchus fissidentatus]
MLSVAGPMGRFLGLILLFPIWSYAACFYLWNDGGHETVNVLRARKDAEIRKAYKTIAGLQAQLYNMRQQKATAAASRANR